LWSGAPSALLLFTHGQLEDPFGHRWNIDQHLRDVPHEEVVAAAAQAFS
jgi:PhnB protein